VKVKVLIFSIIFEQKTECTSDQEEIGKML